MKKPPEGGWGLTPLPCILLASRYPDKSGKPGKRRVTPAMAAKLTDHVCSFEELFETAMPAKVAA